MFNLKARVQAQNVMWVKRFMAPYNAGWKEVLKFYLDKRGGHQIFSSNVDLSMLSLTLPPFYHHVLTLWCSISSTTPCTAEEIQNQSIWNNRFIRIGQKSVYYHEWVELGFNKIGDLLDGNGNFLDFNNSGLQKGQFLKWYGVLSSIPIFWRAHLGTSKCVNHDGDRVGWFTHDGFKELDVSKSHDFYNHFNTPAGEAISTFHLKNTHHFDDKQCEKAYALPFKVTLDSKLRWMQTCIIHKILPTNSWLYRAHLRIDGLCPFCHLWCDLDHLFFECDITARHLQEVIICFPFLPMLSMTEILYGILDMEGDNMLINQMILIFKKCVFKCCGLGHRPSIEYFNSVLSETFQLEKVIAQRKNKLDVHYSKWDKVINSLNW